MGVLRAVLARWVSCGEVADSTFETVVSALLARHGMPEPVFHQLIGGYEVDFAVPGSSVAVEVDGWAVHGRRAAFEADRARDLALAAQGWLVVRLTWWAVINRPGQCLDRLRQVLELRSVARAVSAEPTAPRLWERETLVAGGLRAGSRGACHRQPDAAHPLPPASAPRRPRLSERAFAMLARPTGRPS
ncbi:MAG: DUF559 domain-containing protein [Acidimicrobiia bacterium]|nr:DUF559 domain-containing protein [Acidimicrobiia bacterium]